MESGTLRSARRFVLHRREIPAMMQSSVAVSQNAAASSFPWAVANFGM